VRALLVVAVLAIVGLVYFLSGGWAARSDRPGDRTAREASRSPRGAVSDSPDILRKERGASGETRERETPRFWRVRFVGRDGKPVLPRPVLRRDEGETRCVDVEPTDGLFLIPPKKTWIHYRRPSVPYTWPITEPDTTIRLDRFVPVMLEIRDADSGAIITTLSGGHGDTEHDNLTRPATLIALEGRVVLWRRTPTRLSRYADSVRIVVPAWREADIRLSVLGPDGVEKGAVVEFAYLGGSFVTDMFKNSIIRVAASTGRPIRGAKGTSDSNGLLRVRAVPLIDGEVVRLVVGKNERRAIVEVRMRRGTRASAIVRLPVSPSEFATLVAESPDDLDDMEEEESDPRAGQGSLIVRAYRNGGAVAAHAKVRLIGDREYEIRTNAQGVATFEEVAADRYSLRLEEPGILYVEARQVIRGGVAHAATLMEPRGWSIEVRVVDDRGHAVPSAAIRVSPAGRLDYVRIVDRVQWIDHLTGRDGTLQVGPLPPGEAEITAIYGTRRTTVKARSSQSAVVIRLPEAR